MICRSVSISEIFATASSGLLNSDASTSMKRCGIDDRLRAIPFHFVEEVCRANGEKARRGQVLSKFEHHAAIRLGSNHVREIAAIEEFTFDFECELHASIEPDKNRCVTDALLAV